MKAALLGFGTVGVGVFEMSVKDEHIEISKILCLNPQDVPQGKGAENIEDILKDKNIDTVIEVMGGLHPAWEYVSAAMKAGKNVVTANKHLVCSYYKDILTLAKENNVAFRCTAAVGGGIPWLVNLERATKNDMVTQVGGILNGTTNYILHTMDTQGLPFDKVLKVAQNLGYAEQDPSADIDGLDIARKLAISANVAFGTDIKEENLDIFGIRSILHKDIEMFKKLGYVCKLLALAGKNQNDSIYAYVQPTLIKEGQLLSCVPANYNMAVLEGEYTGKQSFFGQGAGRYPTAYNVMGDLRDIQNGTKHFYTEKAEPKTVDNSQRGYRWYIRTAASNILTENIAQEYLQEGMITGKLSVKVMHEIMDNILKEDAEAFMAAIEE